MDALVVQAQPNIIAKFTPKPKYYVIAGNYAEGEVIDIAEITKAKEVPYREGTYSMTAILTEDNKWEVMSTKSANEIYSAYNGSKGTWAGGSSPSVQPNEPKQLIHLTIYNEARDPEYFITGVTETPLEVGRNIVVYDVPTAGVFPVVVGTVYILDDGSSQYVGTCEKCGVEEDGKMTVIFFRENDPIPPQHE